MEQVPISPAFVWRCEDCGIDNFEYCVPATEEMLKDIKEQEGFYEFESSPFDETTNWVTFPDIVICTKCHKQFETFEPDDDGDDDGIEEDSE